jgi:hypothetical protein
MIDEPALMNAQSLAIVFDGLGTHIVHPDDLLAKVRGSLRDDFFVLEEGLLTPKIVRTINRRRLASAIVRGTLMMMAINTAIRPPDAIPAEPAPARRKQHGARGRAHVQPYGHSARGADRARSVVAV